AGELVRDAEHPPRDGDRLRRAAAREGRADREGVVLLGRTRAGSGGRELAGGVRGLPAQPVTCHLSRHTTRQKNRRFGFSSKLLPEQWLTGHFRTCHCHLPNRLLSTSAERDAEPNSAESPASVVGWTGSGAVGKLFFAGR